MENLSQRPKPPHPEEMGKKAVGQKEGFMKCQESHNCGLDIPAGHPKEEENRMETKFWKDLDGNWWKEIIYNKYKILEELQEQYRIRGAKTWLNIYDYCGNKWILTIQEAA